MSKSHEKLSPYGKSVAAARWETVYFNVDKLLVALKRHDPGLFSNNGGAVTGRALPVRTQSDTKEMQDSLAGSQFMRDTLSNAASNGAQPSTPSVPQLPKEEHVASTVEELRIQRATDARKLIDQAREQALQERAA